MGEPVTVRRREQSFGRSVTEIVPGVILSIAVASLIFLPRSAIANHGDGGSPGEYLDRDNNDQGWIRVDLTTAGEVACNHGAARLDNTEIRMNGPGDPSDISCRDAHYNASWFGKTDCDVLDDTEGRCDHYVLRFDLSSYGQLSNDFEREQYRYIGCHEFGHTSSVGHRPDPAVSCMDNASNHQTFDEHDHDAINADY